ncbi:MAG: hypothetical protein FRX48_06200 [Lasallia pustulata]|nr:MAG: hypothetical protein FRX48_06200 [Lasallia pustulata]
MTPNLPAPRSFTASLFAQLSALSAPPSRTPSSNPLNDAPAALKNVFLTLHCLFPNELLAALDLLDRRLVTRLVVSCPRVDEACGPHVSRDNAVYYVRSSQPTRASRYAAAGGSSYEVRLKAWNCSCPAFTFSAVNAMEENGVHGGDVDVDGLEEGSIDAESGSDYGGLMLEAGAVPLCKHLLACFLAEKCGMFSGFVEERVVGREEAAGWAAGWGD